MIRASRFFFWLILCLTPAARSAEFDEKIVDALAAKALHDFEAPGLAIAIVKDDKVLLAKGYGLREIGGTKPVTADTLFAIASCSKAFTAASVGVLVDEGKMKWDDPIAKHLPGFHLADPFADREVTLRDALCHRTGLSRHDILWIKSPYSRAELLGRVAHLQPTTSFRSTWEYNNIMFVAAGEAVGKAAGSSWEAVVQKQIFAPLGMKTACFSVQVAEKLDHARPHRRADDRKIEAFAWDSLDNVAPAGAINANVNELTAWLRLHLSDGKLNGKQVLARSTVQEMHTAQMVVRNEGYFSIFFPPDVTDHLTYGLGWFNADYRGHLCISHGGTLEGFRAQTVLVPKQKLGLVVLTNLGGCRLPEALSKNLLDALLSLPERDWNQKYTTSDKEMFDKALADTQKRKKERKPDTKPSLPLEDYAGQFAAADYGDARVAFNKDKGELSLHWNGQALPLTHFHFDTFTFVSPIRGWADERVTFRLDGSAKAAGFTFVGRDFKKR
jgi:CubicO group peptidase (beta-lactamase class C family)